MHSDDAVSSASQPFSPPTPAFDAPRHSLLRNASTLFVGQGIGLIAPLVTIPYLARVLGPAAWGPVIAAQALGNWLILIFEFGFDLSGTRAVARARSEPATLPTVVHGVQSAKSLLVLASLPVLALVLFAIPALREHPLLIGWAVVFAAFRGLNPLWFFQGIERVQGPVLVDTAARSAAAFGVFVFVKGPVDGWRVLALQAVFAAVALVVLTILLARHVPLKTPRRAAALATLKEGSSIFACRAWTGLYIQGNALILAAIASPATVAFFGGAERIVRAAINMLQPLTQAFLPRLSYLQETDRPAAQRMIRRALGGVGLLGVAMGSVAYFGAPLLVNLLLGPSYSAAIPVLRLLAILPILVAINGVLGLYWALPLGYERYFLVSIIAAGITNVALALTLVPRHGAAGMATSAIVAEIVVLFVLGTRYVREGA